MEAGRSKGVVMICWFLILSGIYFCANSILQYRYIMAGPMNIWAKIPYILYICFDIALIYCAFKTLALEDWARRYLVVLLILGIGISLFSLANSLTVIENHWDLMKMSLGEQAREEYRPLFKGALIFAAGISVLFKLSLIFFFTRPKVREQFQALAEPE